MPEKCEMSGTEAKMIHRNSQQDDTNNFEWLSYSYAVGHGSMRENSFRPLAASFI